MKLIVISHPIVFPNEHRVIESLFENGLEIFHIHKPSFSEQEIQNYIQQFPQKYHSRIFLHSQFPKFHSLKELESLPLTPSQGRGIIFLSPIFDSISKTGYKSKFDLKEIKSFLQKQKALPFGEGLGGALIALGGINESKIEICRELGFAGVAVLGAIWNSENPLEKFLRIKEKCQKKDLVF